MSTTEPKNTDDKANETSRAKATPDKPHRGSHPGKKGQQHYAVPLFGLLLISGIAGGAWLYQNMNRHNAQQQGAINVLREQVNAAQQQSATQLNTLQEKLIQQQVAQEELRDNLATLLKRNDHLRKDWLLGEAEYLLKLASYRLQLERDVPTALRAMQIADERLHTIGDPALLSVRKVLAEDQNALKNVPAADTSGMSLTLSALMSNIDKLPLSTPSPETAQDPQADNSAARHISNWKELPAFIWQEIKGLVKIRQHDTNIAALLGPKEQFYLLQNLQLQLEQARLALLLGKGNVYRERLQTAQGWLQRFFDLKDSAVQNTLQTLQQLAAINIEPQLPSIDKSYQALKSYMAGLPAVDSSLPQDKVVAAPKPKHKVKQVAKTAEKKTGNNIAIEKVPDEKATTSNKVQP